MKKLCTSALHLTLLALLFSLFTLPAAAATPAQTYFSDNNIPVAQTTPVELPMTYVVWNENDESDFLLREGSFVVDDCTISPAAKAGYQTVTLEVTAFLEIVRDDNTGVLYDFRSWGNAFYDYFTGVQFNSPSLFGQVSSFSHSQTITWGGRNHEISYSKENEWIYPDEEWMPAGDGTFVRPSICLSTVTFTVPIGYNGLVYKLAEHITPGISSSEIPTEISYAAEDAPGEYFRFGHTPTEALPRDGLDISIYDQGFSSPQGYNVTNRGTESITGYYALLSYWPKTTWYPERTGPDGHFEESEYFYGQLLSLDVDLAPGASLKGDCSPVAVGWSTMTHVWIRFEDKAERDAFYQSSVLKPTPGADKTGYNTYEIDMGKAGIQWMNDNFGIVIKSGKPA